MDDTHLYGRTDDFESVTSSSPGFRLVVGDSGIGKSSFLSSLDAWPHEPLISRPIVLRSIEGALQTAIADAISDCIARYLDDATDAKTAWNVVKSIGERVTSVSGREIVNAVLAGTLSYAESMLGKEAVEVGKRVLGDIAKGGLLGFEDQLAKIRVPDHGSELCAIAAALSEVAERHVVLRLDNAERLAPSDRGLMTELVDAVKGNVWIVACVTPHNESGDGLIQQVSVRGDDPHELKPLSSPALEQWLSASEVPRARWDTIIRLSSGYPFFVHDAIRLNGLDGSLDDLTAPNGFQALMRASWKRIPAAIQSKATRLAPFADPPSDDFLMEYLHLDSVQVGILINTLVDSGIFVRRSDGDAWFHDRRRAFIWDEVLQNKHRNQLAVEALEAVAAWMDDSASVEAWVPTAAAVLTRAAEPPAPESLTSSFHTMSDQTIALLWGLIEVVEPFSTWAPAAVIGEVVRHAEERSGLALDALELVNQLQTAALIETRETQGVGLIRSKIVRNIHYASLLGEIQLRFHSTPRPHLASVAFGAFIQPVLGGFEEAILSLGRSSLADHKHQSSQLLRGGRVLGGNRKHLTLGATVSVDDQSMSFTAKFSTPEARSDAERTIKNISGWNARVQMERLVTMPQPRLPYSRYRLGVEALGLNLEPTHKPTDDQIIRAFDLRAEYANALGTVSSPDEIEVFGLDLRRYLVNIHEPSSSWARSFTAYEVRTAHLKGTQDVSRLLSTSRDPLAELQLRAAGILTGKEHIERTLFQAGNEISLAHPLVEILRDIEKAAKAYNDGFPSLLFAPDAEMLERKILAERLRVLDVAETLADIGDTNAEVRRNSLLVTFWEDKETELFSDFGHWSACAFEIDDGQGKVAVRRVDHSPIDGSVFPDLVMPAVFEDYAGAEPVSSTNGNASSIIAKLLGYPDQHTRLMDFDTELGRMIRNSGTYVIID